MNRDQDIDQATALSFLRGDIDASALPEPNWGPIGEEVYKRTYSRPVVDSDGTERNEVWAETVRRVVLGNIAYAPEDTIKENEAVELFELMYDFKILPAGRHLWVTGTDMIYTRNCWHSGWDKRTSDHFRFLAARLFEGGGVGANYSRDLTGLTDPIVGTIDLAITAKDDHEDFKAIVGAAGTNWISRDGITQPDTLDTDQTTTTVDGDTTIVHVGDSREGWVDAWMYLIDTATTPGHHNIVVDTSTVRPHGAILKTFGGKASGPAPLADAAVQIVDVLNQAASEQRRLGGVDSMDIDHAIASAVVAGGARRSARMSIMHWADPEIESFLKSKHDASKHWSTNISVEIDEDFYEALAAGSTRAENVLYSVADGMARNGEPGFFDSTAHSIGEPERIRSTNPCGEVSLQPFESCNLGSVNLAAIGDDEETAVRAFELVARFLYRATLKSYPDERAAAVEQQNRRIGVGLMGLQGWVAAHGGRLSDLWANERLLDKLHTFRTVSRTSADDIADTLGLPRSVKVTSIAPTGTIAQMPGTTPGLHPVMARYFTRRVRYADTDNQLVDLEERGFHIEDAIMEARTKIVSFPVKDRIIEAYDEELIEQADEFSFSEFMRLLRAVQESFCYGSDGNAISATAQLPQGMEAEELVEAMRPLLGKMKGVTAFPALSRVQPPYEPLSREEFEAEVEAAEARGNAVVLVAGDSNDGSCDTGACPIR